MINQTLLTALFLYVTLFSGSAQASFQCQDLFQVSELSHRQGPELNRAASQLADLFVNARNETDPGRRSLMDRVFRDAHQRLSQEFGPPFLAEFQRVLAKRQQEHLQKMEQDHKTIMDQSQTLIEMTRIKRHSVGGRILEVLDDHRIIFIEPGILTIYDYRSEKILHQLKSEDIVDVPSPVLSPDRSKLYVFTFRKTGVVDLQLGTVTWHPYPQKVLNNQTVWVTKTNISRDGTLILCGSDEGHFFALDAKEPSELRLLDPSNKPVHEIIESPDGSLFLIVRAFGAERLYDRRWNKFFEAGTITQNQGQMARAIFTADSRQIIFETKFDGVFRHDLATRQTSPFSFPQWSGQTWYTVTSDTRFLLSVDLNSKSPHLMVTDLLTLQPASVGLENLKTQILNGLYYDGHTNTLHFWTHEKSKQRELLSSNLVRVDLTAMGSVIQPMPPQRETRIGGVDPENGHLFQQESGLDQILLERY